MIGTVNDLFKTHSGGRDLSDVPARAFTGFMALANAINNAGSTDPEKIRQALVNLDMSSDSLIVPYRGIKFGADGQNEKTRGILMQVQGGKYCTVYPFELAACKLQYPIQLVCLWNDDCNCGRAGRAWFQFLPLDVDVWEL